MRISGLLLLGLLATAAYPQGKAPAASDPATARLEWDAVMRKHGQRSGLRLAGFAACLMLAHVSGGLKKSGWHLGAPKAPLLMFAAGSAAYVGEFLAFPRQFHFTSGQMAYGWMISLPVALFEEACFRGFIFRFLRRSLAPPRAAMAAAALFMVFHIQGEALGVWPQLFLVGMISCAALHAGVGLPWLALTHFIVDGIAFGTIGPIEPGAAGLPPPYYLGFAVLLVSGFWGMKMLVEEKGSA